MKCSKCGNSYIGVPYFCDDCFEDMYFKEKKEAKYTVKDSNLQITEKALLNIATEIKTAILDKLTQDLQMRINSIAEIIEQGGNENVEEYLDSKLIAYSEFLGHIELLKSSKVKLNVNINEVEKWKRKYIIL